MTRDLTEGSPFRLIVGFAIPVLLSAVFQQFYNFVDAMLVGKILGPQALAAVGATGTVSYMVIGFCSGVCAGFAIPMAQAFGAKQVEDLKKCIGNCLWLCILCSAVLVLLTNLIAGHILQWMNTPQEIFDQAYAYICIIFWGIPATFLYNMLSCMLRSVGDSKTPVFFLAISSVLNIVLDLLFIAGFHLGVGAAAAATVISQCVSGLLCLGFIVRRFPILHPEPTHWKPVSTYIKLLCQMGLPMGLQCSITGIGGTILQAGINSLGTVYVAAVTAAGKLNMTAGCVVEALGTTMATYAGQNAGANKISRINKGMKISILIGAVCAACVLFVFWLAGKPLLTLFLNKGDAAIMDAAYRYLIICTAFYLPLCCVNLFRFSIQGMGHSRLAMFSGVFETIARVVVGVMLIPIFGYWAACIGNPAAWVAANCFLIPAYIHCIRRFNS